MNYEIRWPKKGDNPFLIKGADPNSSTWASIHWLTLLKADDSLFATAFKVAGDKIIKELSRGDDHQPADMFFMPIAFLYRHSLELKMKVIIKLGNRLELIENNGKLSSALEKHKLHQLWNYARKVIESYWQDSPKNEVAAAGKIIQEFHNIDKFGQSLRYSEDLSGNCTLEDLPESVQLTHLKDVFDAIFNFLDGCEMGLDDANDMRNEILSEYSDEFFS